MATLDDWDAIVAMKKKLAGDTPLVWHDVAWRVLESSSHVAGCYSVAIKDGLLWVGDFFFDKRLGGKAGFKLMVDAVRREAQESGLRFCGVVDARYVPMLKALAKEGVLPTFVQVEGC